MPVSAQAHLQTAAPNTNGALRYYAIGAGYVAAYVALDWLSFLNDYSGLGITPWNPQPGLAVAFSGNDGVRHPISANNIAPSSERSAK